MKKNNSKAKTGKMKKKLNYPQIGNGEVFHCMIHSKPFDFYRPTTLSSVRVCCRFFFQVGGFRLPFIVLGGLLLSILPVVMVILPRDERE